MKIKVIESQKERSGYFINHKALVEVEDYDNAKKGEVINSVSISVGYHPLGYGVYGGNIEETHIDGLYKVFWKTGASCD